MINIIKRNIHILLIFLLSTLFISCSTNRTIPPQDVFDALGADDYIITMGLTVNEARELLDAYDISNNYVVSDNDLQVFIVKNQDNGMFYCIFAPHDTKYDIVTIEIPLIDFSIIEDKIDEYSSEDDSLYTIDLCNNYCDLSFTSFFTNDNYQNNEFIDELSYPIIITIGSLTNKSAGVFIGLYNTGEIVVFTRFSEDNRLEVLFTFQF
jgi:hypothetical protein